MKFQEWHDEAERFERTGRLDEGPCWCAECLGLLLRTRGARAAMLPTMARLRLLATAEHERRLARALVQVGELVPRATIYRGGILVSESGYRKLVERASDSGVLDPAPIFASFPVHVAPDWMFDHALIARLRIRIQLVDRWARPLVRALARWFK